MEDITATFINVSNLSIGSASSKTKIICKGSSGFHLRNVSDVSVLFIEFLECGTAFVVPNDSIYTVFATMLVENSLNVILTTVLFTSSNGSGLVMLNIAGNSKLTTCTFTNNTDVLSGSNSSIQTAALYIELSFCTWSNARTIGRKRKPCDAPATIRDSTLLISDCKFIGNKKRKAYGGGLSIFVFRNSIGNKISIERCLFTKNIALSGGGAYFSMQKKVVGNTIQLTNVSFVSNCSPKHSGGGVNAGYKILDHSTNNTIIFARCNFSSNEAKTAGGVAIFSTSSKYKVVSENSIKFTNCIWIKNSATSLGAAFAIKPAYLKSRIDEWFVEVIIENATFSSNFFKRNNDNPGVRSGIMYVTAISARFKGLIVFENNSAAALDVDHSTVNFERGSNVTFNNNHASSGSLNLFGMSAIIVNRNSNFTFNSNTTCKGAAIQQHNIDLQDFVFSKSCFLRYGENETDSEDISQRNINFMFKNNSANCEGFGNSIHLATMLPCNFTYYYDTPCMPKFSHRNIFNCVATFTFLGEDTNRTEISTDATHIVVTSKDIFPIPGKEVDLPFHVVDELDNVISGVYSMSISKGNVSLDGTYKYITENKSKLLGLPGSKATLHIETTSTTRNIEIDLEFTLRQCPPGYVLVDREACKCSTTVKGSKYNCITGCNETLSTALLAQNWWMNFNEDTNLL